MNEVELRQNISQNIVAFRKNCDMTQADLAEKLSYSDKSVSKWERGDGIPDIYVLTRMAELFGVTVNDIIGMQAELPKEEPAPEAKPSRHLFVSALSIGLVWFIAVVAFFIGSVAAPDLGRFWLAFVYAIPVSAIVMIVFSHLWWTIPWRAFSVSLLVWGFALCFHLTASIPNLSNVGLVYTVAAAFEVLVIIWYVYSWTKKRGPKVRKASTEAVDTVSEENAEVDGAEESTESSEKDENSENAGV